MYKVASFEGLFAEGELRRYLNEQDIMRDEIVTIEMSCYRLSSNTWTKIMLVYLEVDEDG